jgi:uncharacterized protein YeaO (DUF488 family)
MTRIRHKRWNDAVDDEDGTRILLSRFRPRGVAKSKETWTEWHRELSPSEPLHAAWYGKLGVTITFAQYKARFLEEMKEQQGWIDALADRVRRGETVTLLCSSACVDPAHCHRTLIKALIEEAVEGATGSSKGGPALGLTRRRR